MKLWSSIRSAAATLTIVGVIVATSWAEDLQTQVRSLQIGGGTVEVISRQTPELESTRWLLCNLHDDENTSVEAALQLLPAHPVRLVELRHSGEREMAFPVDGQQYRCDPNRIFTAVGVRATLEKLSHWSEAADHEVARLGRQLIELYQLDKLDAVVALHNNSDARYAASSYLPGSEYADDAAAVHIVPGSDPDDFFFVTTRPFYSALAKQGFNVVLQDNQQVTDDGSLSVYCGQQGVPYVNVEAQHGHLAEQVRMLESLLAVLASMKRAHLVDLATLDAEFVIETPYATERNFANTKFYPANRAFLERQAALRLVRVQKRLAAQGLGLKIFDGYRPLSVQKKMWEVMPDPNYVANPAKGSRHNRGCAVDVTLVDSAGNELPMPTRFDEFTERAHHDFVDLPADVLRNRQTLKAAMMAEGFEPLATEWWHYDAPGWQQYPVMDIDPWENADELVAD